MTNKDIVKAFASTGVGGREIMFDDNSIKTVRIRTKCLIETAS